MPYRYRNVLTRCERLRGTRLLLSISTVQPKFFRPRSVPFAIKEAVGKEIERLERAGILEKVDHSEWAAPIVPVPKKDGKIRICGDYKVTINPYLKSRSASTTYSRRNLCHLGRRQAIHKIRSIASLSTNSIG